MNDVPSSLVVNEALCFLQSRCAKAAKSEIITALSDFYTYEEMLTAKKILFDFATSLKVDYAPVFTERKGANRRSRAVHAARCPQGQVPAVRRSEPTAPSCGNGSIILGDIIDMNFVCSDSHAGFKQCSTVFSNYEIHNCDDLCLSSDKATYCNASLGQSSFIDHFFVSNSVRPLVRSLSIIDSGANLSDHKPLVGNFDLHKALHISKAPPKASSLSNCHT
jgi:hypothetical protein